MGSTIKDKVLLTFRFGRDHDDKIKEENNI